MLKDNGQVVQLRTHNPLQVLDTRLHAEAKKRKTFNELTQKQQEDSISDYGAVCIFQGYEYDDEDPRIIIDM